MAQLMPCLMQGGLPTSNATQGFAQQLLDRLPGQSGSNDRAPLAAPTQRAQDAAARAMLRQNAQYNLLLDDEEDDGDASAYLPAPTTAAVPKKKEKKIRKDRAGGDCPQLIPPDRRFSIAAHSARHGCL